MKLLKAALFASVTVVITLYSVQKSHAQDNISSKSNAPIQFDNIYFQEWEAGKQSKNMGFNIFLPNVTTDENIELKEVYFRNLKAKLFKADNQYMATLEKTQEVSSIDNLEKAKGLRFHLRDTECVITYVEGGKTKYMKASVFDQRAKTYYKFGPKPIYKNQHSSGLVNSRVEDE